MPSLPTLVQRRWWRYFFSFCSYRRLYTVQWCCKLYKYSMNNCTLNESALLFSSCRKNINSGIYLLIKKLSWLLSTFEFEGKRLWSTLWQTLFLFLVIQHCCKDPTLNVLQSYLSYIAVIMASVMWHYVFNVFCVYAHTLFFVSKLIIPLEIWQELLLFIYLIYDALCCQNSLLYLALCWSWEHFVTEDVQS